MRQPAGLFGMAPARRRRPASRRSGAGCGAACGRGRGGRGRRGRLRLCAGLIQQAWTRLLSVSATLGSIWPQTGSGSGTSPGRGRRGSRTGREIEMAKRGVEIVEPHQAHHPAAEPDAFRVTGRAVMACAASTNSSVLRWLSSVASATGPD